MSKLWGGRFEGKTNRLVEELGESVSFDARLAPWDIRGSIAHARMLGACGIISKADMQRIVTGLKGIAKLIDAGKFAFDPTLEDVHTNIEAALVKRIGAAGKRLHTGRSRNDQIALDVRLWMRDQIDAIDALLLEMQRALVRFADRHIDVVLPGCTHLQHAQPVLFAHHMLAYYEMFGRDRDRFAELRKRVNICPLGSAALAGTPYKIDRAMVAKALEFDGVTRNSMDAVADRDHAVEFCAHAATVMMHLSRMCEELVLWSTQEYAFIEIGDAFTTGSSIMPQKKNPDVAEIVRGKTGRVYGDLNALLVLMKGLPLTYNRDLQEDKEPVFDASDTVQLCLAVTAQMIPSIHVNRERMAEACRDGFLEATDLADFLVERGVPFREAHGVVGRLVLYCAKHKKRLPELTVAELKQHAKQFDADALKAIELEAMLKRRDQPGGTAPKRVKAALKRAMKASGIK